jgi:hypothetical protein
MPLHKKERFFHVSACFVLFPLLEWGWKALLATIPNYFLSSFVRSYNFLHIFYKMAFNCWRLLFFLTYHFV